ncbi:MAG: hypothetical protein EOP11_11345 [Proteobacteria bacterium]|nr:MAG: hypothetical protein EOP11_11345 [Pseudomonadota bacterium]
MKRTKMFLQGLAVSACLITTAGASAPAAFAAETFTGADFTSTGYVLREDVVLNPLNEAGPRRAFTLSAGSEIAILGKKEDAALGTLLHVGIDAKEGSGIPADLWVSDRELPEIALEPYAAADESEESGDVAILKAMTYCYRYVKQYLLQTGQVKVYLPGVSAWEAAGILPKHGFRRTGHSPSTAKNGEVCVYSGGPAGHGHIEVKRNGKWWYGYGFKPNPMSGRRFIACFAK